MTTDKKETRPKAIIGLQLSGLGRKIVVCSESNKILFPSNKYQHYIERKAICSILESKIKTIVPPKFDVLDILWAKNAKIYGNKLYCECKKCKEHRKIHFRYLKGGKKHGQTATFKGDNSISIVLHPVIQNKPISLTEPFSLEQIS